MGSGREVMGRLGGRCWERVRPVPPPGGWRATVLQGGSEGSSGWFGWCRGVEDCSAPGGRRSIPQATRRLCEEVCNMKEYEPAF